MRQQEIQQQEDNIKVADVLSIHYNQIHIREEDTKRERVIYFDGLQKRVLNDVDEEILKRCKKLEFTDRENFWDIGINFLVCCDKCKNALFSLNADDDFNDKNICQDCEKWLCSDCFNFKEKLCLSCLRKKTLRNI